jgi:hypothetical protein
MNARDELISYALVALPNEIAFEKCEQLADAPAPPVPDNTTGDEGELERLVEQALKAVAEHLKQGDWGNAQRVLTSFADDVQSKAGA